MRPSATCRAALAGAVLAAMLGRGLGAQRIPEPAVRAPAASSPAAADAPGAPDGSLPRRGAAPRWAPVASLILPGTGQLAMRQSRGVGYIAAEIYGLIQVIEGRREERRSRNEYRKAARQVARVDFGGTADGPWEYYEALADYIGSGKYSSTTGYVTPETDPQTYNGREWLLNLSLAGVREDETPSRSDPRYQKALAAYSERAIREGYLWSWSNHQLEWDLYRAEIDRENQATRDVTTTLFLMGANHLVSSIDALATVRLRRLVGPAGARGIEASVPWPRLGRRGTVRR